MLSMLSKCAGRQRSQQRTAGDRCATSINTLAATGDFAYPHTDCESNADRQTGKLNISQQQKQRMMCPELRQRHLRTGRKWPWRARKQNGAAKKQAATSVAQESHRVPTRVPEASTSCPKVAALARTRATTFASCSGNVNMASSASASYITVERETWKVCGGLNIRRLVASCCGKTSMASSATASCTRAAGAREHTCALIAAVYCCASALNLASATKAPQCIRFESACSTTGMHWHTRNEVTCAQLPGAPQQCIRCRHGTVIGSNGTRALCCGTFAAAAHPMQRHERRDTTYKSMEAVCCPNSGAPCQDTPATIAHHSLQRCHGGQTCT